MHPVNIITSTGHLLSSSFCAAPLDLLGFSGLLLADEAGLRRKTHDNIAFTGMA
jgi:hypothetical protein